VIDTDKRHKGEVIKATPQLTLGDSMAQSPSVDRLSVSEDDNCSSQSSLPCRGADDDLAGSCARTCFVLPVERWSGKRKWSDDTIGSKHLKTSKPMWVDGLTRDADESLNEISHTRSHVDSGPASHSGQIGTPSPTKSTASSSAASSPMKLADKCVPATKAQPPPPPPLQLSPTSQPTSRRQSLHETESSVKKRPPNGDGGKRTRLSVAESGSKTFQNNASNSTKAHRPVTENAARARTAAGVVKSSAVSPTSAAVSSIVGMSPPATPVMPDTQVTPSRKQSKQKARGQRDPSALPCKGNTTCFSFDHGCVCEFVIFLIAIVILYDITVSK